MRWNQLLSSMDEETFKDLRYAVTQEGYARLSIRVQSFPSLSAEEKQLAKDGETVLAIKAYRNRLNTDYNPTFCGIAEAKEKIEQWLAKNEPLNNES